MIFYASMVESSQLHVLSYNANYALYAQICSHLDCLMACKHRCATLEQHERSGGGGRRREGGVSSSFTDARALATSHGHLFLANAVLTADPSRISLPMACYRGDLPIVEGVHRLRFNYCLSTSCCVLSCFPHFIDIASCHFGM